MKYVIAVILLLFSLAAFADAPQCDEEYHYCYKTPQQAAAQDAESFNDDYVKVFYSESNYLIPIYFNHDRNFSISAGVIIFTIQNDSDYFYAIKFSSKF